MDARVARNSDKEVLEAKIRTHEETCEKQRRICGELTAQVQTLENEKHQAIIKHDGELIQEKNKVVEACEEINRKNEIAQLLRGRLQRKEIMGDFAEENVEQLFRVHECGQSWATKHASIFVLKEYQLMHFYSPHSGDYSEYEFSDQDLEEMEDEADEEKYASGSSLNLPGFRVQSLRLFKYFGVLFSPKLTFEAHVTYLEAKCFKRLAIFNALAAFIWGIGTLNLRMIYVGTVLSYFFYCVSAWYQFKRGLNHEFRKQRHLNLFNKCRSTPPFVLLGPFESLK